MAKRTSSTAPVRERASVYGVRRYAAEQGNIQRVFLTVEDAAGLKTENFELIIEINRTQTIAYDASGNPFNDLSFISSIGAGTTLDAAWSGAGGGFNNRETALLDALVAIGAILA